MNDKPTTAREGWASAEDLMRHYGGISPSTLDRFVEAGVLPPPAKLGNRLNRWQWADVAIADKRLLAGNAAYRAWVEAGNAAKADDDAVLK